MESHKCILLAQADSIFATTNVYYARLLWNVQVSNGSHWIEVWNPGSLVHQNINNLVHLTGEKSRFLIGNTVYLPSWWIFLVDHPKSIRSIHNQESKKHFSQNTKVTIQTFSFRNMSCPKVYLHTWPRSKRHVTWIRSGKTHGETLESIGRTIIYEQVLSIDCHIASGIFTNFWCHHAIARDQPSSRNKKTYLRRTCRQFLA